MCVLSLSLSLSLSLFIHLVHDAKPPALTVVYLMSGEGQLKVLSQMDAILTHEQKTDEMTYAKTNANTVRVEWLFKSDFAVLLNVPCPLTATSLPTSMGFRHPLGFEFGHALLVLALSIKSKTCCEMCSARPPHDEVHEEGTKYDFLGLRAPWMCWAMGSVNQCQIWMHVLVSECTLLGVACSNHALRPHPIVVAHRALLGFVSTSQECRPRSHQRRPTAERHREDIKEKWFTSIVS